MLRIGLTLAVGMRRSELTGVIAHELAHFSQGGAARAHILLSTVESWASEADLEAHKTSDAMKGMAAIGAFLGGAPVMHTYGD